MKPRFIKIPSSGNSIAINIKYIILIEESSKGSRITLSLIDEDGKNKIIYTDEEIDVVIHRIEGNY